jgi:YHS domain-containing protein
MKSLRLLDSARVAAVVIVVGIDAVSASDQQTQIAVQNSAEKWPIFLAQNAVPKEKGNKTAKVNVDKKGVILKGYDAVAYFKEGKPVKGNPEIKSSYQGATYLFASAEDKADFDNDPAKYAPQYGGFCAYAITLGMLGDIEGPEAFAVYNGKLYICGNETALKEFRADIDRNIEKADRQWRRISKL